MNKKVELGDKVRDKVSGFVGIATSKTEFLNGCIQCDIIPKVGKDNKPSEGICMDLNNLEVVRKGVIKKPKVELDEEYPDGGPNHPSIIRSRY